MLYKDKIKGFILLFSQYSLLAWKTTLQSRLGTYLFLAAKLVRVLLSIALLVFIFVRQGGVGGYTMHQALIFYFSFLVIDTITQTLFREVYRFRSILMSGAFDMVLLKPQNPLLRILLGGIDFTDLVLLIPYIGVLIYLIGGLAEITGVLIALYVLLMLSGLLIAAAFHILSLAVGIYTTQVEQTILVYRDLSSIGRYPMRLYPEIFRFALTFIVPVGMMANIPADLVVSRIPTSLVFVSFFCSIAWITTSILLWRRSLRYYQSWGG